MTMRLFTKTNTGRLAVAALLVIWILWALPTAARSATLAPAPATTAAPVAPVAAVQDRGNIIEFGKDVYLGPGQRAHTVTVFGGDVTVAGTIEHNLTVFGGSVTLDPTAVVGSDMASSDVAVTVVGGKIVRDTGATVVGRTWHGLGSLRSHAHGYAGFGILGFFGDIMRTIFLTAVAVVLVALAPRRIGAARDIIGRQPLPALGWGAAGLILGVPVVSVALAITIIGLVVLVPWLLFIVPLIIAAGFAAAAAFVGRWLLEKLGRAEVGIVGATAAGALAMCLALFVPVVGCLAVFFGGLIGLGAILMVSADWMRGRRAARKARQTAATDAPAGPDGPTPAINGTAS